MKSTLLSLVGALVLFAGISAIAGPPQTLYCNGTVSFGPLDCNGTASLACGPNGAILSYNMTGCLYYTYDNGYATPISQVAPLQLNTIYRAKLTRTPEHEGQGTVLTVNTYYNGPQPVPQPVPPQPQAPTCSADVVAATQTRGQAIARVSCSPAMATVVEVYDNDGDRLCRNNQFAALPEDMGEACRFTRDPMHRLNFTVNVYDMNGNRLTSQEGVLYKEATFNYAPQGAFLNAQGQPSSQNIEIAPPAQNKAFNRGRFWKFTVKAVVSDQDVDPGEGQQLIRVQLIDISTGKVLADTTANSGQLLNFDLEHQSVTGHFAHETTEGLQLGHNVLKLKIYDAYDPQGEDRVVWPSQEFAVDLN